jgi:hypothetical protein
MLIAVLGAKSDMEILTLLAAQMTWTAVNLAIEGESNGIPEGK